ncbi:putative methylesterase 11, chloroplastic isoform X2 [Primulina tabacum]|uniref:putative methylesterase 11, chloroplastic isoform X2 n=1 Tax=Primulina tabacum TaxID=48773 RepID=UPI003F59D810
MLNHRRRKGGRSGSQPIRRRSEVAEAVYGLKFGRLGKRKTLFTSKLLRRRFSTSSYIMAAGGRRLTDRRPRGIPLEIQAGVLRLCLGSRAPERGHSLMILCFDHLTTSLISKMDNLETNHFVLVHGGGFGAWCWYKNIAFLEERGYKVTAIDLTGSGIHSFDTNRITSLAQYVKPLTDFFEKLADGEKVVLVGHDLGGACISYAMELFPSKVSKSIFVAAVMLTNGQSSLDIFSEKVESNDLMRQAQVFLYDNGDSHPPTAINYDRSLSKELLFNQSSAKDVALASVSMRPIPFSPVLEKLTLSEMKHGRARRFYIETIEDKAMPSSVQRNMIANSPPEQVFSLKGADHSPFFSKPQALHKLLVEISKIP